MRTLLEVLCRIVGLLLKFWLIVRWFRIQSKVVAREGALVLQSNMNRYLLLIVA
jgi:hypothetical protein